jgi:hypothetical protein
MNSSSYALSIDGPVCRYVDLDSFADLPPAQVLSEEECARAQNLRFPSVGSLAEWRQTEDRAHPSGAGSGGGRMSPLNAFKAIAAVRCAGVAP